MKTPLTKSQAEYVRARMTERQAAQAEAQGAETALKEFLESNPVAMKHLAAGNAAKQRAAAIQQAIAEYPATLAEGKASVIEESGELFLVTEG